ncbi:hypothetical protein COCMIDRAFT_103850 [Bipolaris oryzae ATCC 44560]|uniref:Uncharacterized protein n=1 Tax=Bipolaris oryzae ATCC 44560 TaxID=930090 RepID=W6YXN1_COCMI|nr:uncharacterized protein COCMIDRAFT_103850 [Bipolaris oryzae ATCC 44560]EUC42310.1 hypothetical protein COCMIDRAFT_103850 [Bipolaris oryzae ATCC 44560]
MSDIDKSFVFLQDNIPQWLHQITTADDRVTAMQHEITKVSISQSPFAKHKSDSTASIRPGKLDAIAEDAAPADPIVSRKRKSLSVTSDQEPDSARHRSRVMVVTSYDGDMQRSFELLVRAFGTGRNLLRKAKMEARMNDMATMASSSEEEDDDDDDDEDEISPAKVNYKARMSALRARSAARRSGRLGVSSGVETPAELFDSTDKILEQAQELCEKAAHLTLRDGDCRKELATIRKSFETLLETAKTEVDKCNARKSQDPPELQAHETSDTSMSSLEPEPVYRKDVHSLPVAHEHSKSAAGSRDAVVAKPLNSLNIEVDENDDSDEEFVLPPIRLTSRFNR